MPNDTERKSIVGAALTVGWVLIWAFVVAQVSFPGSLPSPDVGAAVAASAAWLAFVLAVSSLLDLFQKLLSGPRPSSVMKGRWFPIAACVVGLIFARFAWS
jgi:hypothetical protein